MPKPQTIRATEPNAGTRKAFARKVAKFRREAREQFALGILRWLYVRGYLVEDLTADALPPGMSEEDLGLDFFKRAFKVSPLGLAYAGGVSALVEQAAAETTARWLIAQGEEARKVSYWFCRTVARDVTSSQRRVLRAAGVSTGWLDRAWTVPIVRGVKVPPRVEDLLGRVITGNERLLEKLVTQEAVRLQEVMLETLTKGETTSSIRAAIDELQLFDDRRSEMFAADLTARLTQEVALENDAAVGITRGVWTHVPGKWSSRETHVKFDGQVFELGKGLYDEDPDVDRYVLPGELPYCKCVYRAILPDELTDEK